MTGLFSAIRFLTILPAGASGTFHAKEMVRFFPLVGLLIGCMVLAADLLFRLLWPVSIASLLDVMLLAILTGGLHLDGLADTADGLLGHHSRDRALSIMKDSRIGVMGMAAIFFSLTVKWAALSNLCEYRYLMLVLVPSLARGGMMFGIVFLPYGRSENGTGHAFFQERHSPSTFIFLTIPVLLAFLAFPSGLRVIAVFGLLVLLLLLYFYKRIGCITGDMLGATAELTESLLFLTAAIHSCPSL